MIGTHTPLWFPTPLTWRQNNSPSLDEELKSPLLALMVSSLKCPTANSKYGAFFPRQNRPVVTSDPSDTSVYLNTLT
ncbi:MAG: hypothetical protein IPH94_09235 [Saprospiraceae bacterium]|nr:hypothetical protein [Saprospiraceae bacterium]